MTVFSEYSEDWSQGELSSTYSNWFAGQLQDEAVANWIAHLFYEQNKDALGEEAVLAAVQQIHAALLAGEFNVSDLFTAANLNTKKIDELDEARDSVQGGMKEPSPSLQLTNGELENLEELNDLLSGIDLSGMLDGFRILQWDTEAGGGKNSFTIEHYRAFFAELNEPSSYNEDWMGGSEPQLIIEVTAGEVELTETNSRDIYNDDDQGPEAAYGDDREAVEEHVNLLDSQYISYNGDPDNLEVTDTTLFIRNVEGDVWEAIDWPEYMSLSEGVITIDKNHPDLDDLRAGDELLYKVVYDIDDGPDGADSVENYVTITITGTDDIQTYSESITQEWLALDGSGHNDSFVFVGAHFDDRLGDESGFEGTVKISVNGDLNHSSETVDVTVEGHDTVELGATGPSSNPSREPGGSNYGDGFSDSEEFEIDPSLIGLITDDGVISVDYELSGGFGESANGVHGDGSITVELEYSYWA